MESANHVFEGGEGRFYCGFAPVVRITLPQSSASAAMNFDSSAGLLPVDTMLISVSRLVTSGCRMTSPTAAEILVVSSPGMPGGATIAHHDVTKKPGSTSETAGTSGRFAIRLSLLTASGRNWPDWMY